MPSGKDETRALSLRALIIFCALLSLCVSDTVGPRLLPLPAAAAHSASHTQTVEDASPAPSGGASELVRVVMAAPARKHDGAGHHSLHAIPHADVRLVTPPGIALTYLQTTCPPSPASSAAVTRPPGRAPPPSV